MNKTIEQIVRAAAAVPIAMLAADITPLWMRYNRSPQTMEDCISYLQKKARPYSEELSKDRNEAFNSIMSAGIYLDYVPPQSHPLLKRLFPTVYSIADCISGKAAKRKELLNLSEILFAEKAKKSYEQKDSIAA
jgi:hypothetical protein